jgi:hypothetical protein
MVFATYLRHMSSMSRGAAPRLPCMRGGCDLTSKLPDLHVLLFVFVRMGSVQLTGIMLI